MNQTCVLVVTSLLFVGCGRDLHYDENSFPASQLSTIGGRIGLTFPQGSQGLNMFEKGAAFQPYILARILIPPQGQSNLIAAVQKKPAHRGTVDLTYVLSDVDWWVSPGASVQADVHWLTNSGDYVRVISCREPNGHFVLYVVWIAAD